MGMSIFEEISKKFCLPNAWNDWVNYRDSLTDLIIGYGKKTDSKTVSIIGAGRCNDVDLSRLTEHFEKIVLFDYDFDSMKEAIVSCGPEGRSRDRVEIRVSSLAGLKKEDLENFFEKVMMRIRGLGDAFEFDKVETILSEEIEALKLVITESMGNLHRVLPKTDIMVCNGVFSQLLSTISFFLRSVIASVPESFGTDGGSVVKKMEKKLHEINNEMIPDIVSSVVGASKKAAVFGNEYNKDRPVEGAFQCIDAIRRLGRKTEDFTGVWDFNRAAGVRYEMLIQTVYGKT